MFKQTFSRFFVCFVEAYKQIFEVALVELCITFTPLCFSSRNEGTSSSAFNLMKQHFLNDCFIAADTFTAYSMLELIYGL